MPDTELKPCLFCGKTATEVAEGRGLLRWYVHCLECGAGGPLAETEPEAIELWNKREEG